jgi:hypothetical protein
MSSLNEMITDQLGREGGGMGGDVTPPAPLLSKLGFWTDI